MFNFAVWGSSGHAKVLADILDSRGCKIIVFFDNDRRARPAITGVPLLHGMDAFQIWLADRDPSQICGAIAIGGSRGMDRRNISSVMRNAGISTPVLSHETAVVAASSHVQQGTQLLAGCIVASHAQIGEDCIINHKANVDHECVLDAGVHIAPGATLCGCVRVGENTMVGAGAIILPRITIGKNCIIGAGAVVTKSIPDEAVAVGVPARTSLDQIKNI